MFSLFNNWILLWHFQNLLRYWFAWFATVSSLYKISGLFSSRVVRGLSRYNESKFEWCHTYFRDLWWFWGGFWGAKIIKSEQIPKNIWKFPKHNLTNNFFGNLKIESKGNKKIWRLSQPFEGTGQFLCAFWGESTVKIKQNIKKIYSKIWQT